jgi:hypothetical protein
MLGASCALASANAGSPTPPSRRLHRSRRNQRRSAHAIPNVNVEMPSPVHWTNALHKPSPRRVEMPFPVHAEMPAATAVPQSSYQAAGVISWGSGGSMPRIRRLASANAGSPVPPSRWRRRSRRNRRKSATAVTGRVHVMQGTASVVNGRGQQRTRGVVNGREQQVTASIVNGREGAVTTYKPLQIAVRVFHRPSPVIER